MGVLGWRSPRPRQSPQAPQQRGIFSPCVFLPLLTVVISYITYVQLISDQRESGTWGCEMSWMTPSYRLIETPDSPVPRYKLWLYREAGYDDDTPSGDPVIFIPGNAGSYMQVRSIASSSSRQYHGDNPDRVAEDMGNLHKRDFFTVDYNEEFSAFHAVTIRDQASYLAHTVQQVLTLYDHVVQPDRPRRVTLLGHSMGGIVARLAAMGIPDLVDMIFTMSTPHLYPPANLDWGIQAIYDQINQQRYDRSGPLLFSICGGVSDSQIVSDACSLSRDLVGEGGDGGFAVFGTGIPGAWTGTDHQAMVWCHQIRWRTARVLLQMSASQERSRKLEMARTWLIGDDALGTRVREEVMTTWQSRTYPTTGETLSILIHRNSDDPRVKTPRLSLETCNEDGHCIPETGKIQAYPSPLSPATPFPLPGEGVQPREMSYVVDVTPRDGSREVKVAVPLGVDLSIGKRADRVSQGRQWVTDKIQAQVSHLSLQFPTIRSNSLVVHQVQYELAQCQGLRPVLHYSNAPRTDLENATHESHFYPLTGRPIHLHSHIGHAPFLPTDFKAGMRLDVYQSPPCSVQSIKLSVDYGKTLAKALLRYRMILIAWPIGWSAIVLALQLYRAQQASSVPTVMGVIGGVAPKQCAAGMMALPIITILQPVIDPVLPSQTWVLGISDVKMAPLAAVLAVWTSGLVTTVALGFAGGRKVLIRLFGSKEKRAEDDHKPDAATKWSTIITSSSILLVLVLFLVPVQVAWVSLYLIQALLYLSGNGSIKSSRREIAGGILLLLTFSLPFHLVPLGVWARNLWLDWRSSFTTDHDILKIIPLLTIVQLSTISADLRLRPAIVSIAKWSSLVLGVTALLFGLRYLYILPYLMDGVLLCLCGVLWP